MEVVNKKQEKKPTNAQLERRLKNAVMHIDRTKKTKEVWFDDKGLRLIVDEDTNTAVVATGYHRHVFSEFTSSGVSRPFLYLKRFVEMALDNDCEVKDSDGNVTRSYSKLMKTLKEKEDKTEYNIAWFVDLWMFNIYQPLYSIGESEVESFLVYEQYMHNIARNGVLLEEHKEDMTQKQFIARLHDLVDEFTKEIDDTVLLKAKTDEERIQEEVEAIQEQEIENTMKGQANDVE